MLQYGIPKTDTERYMWHYGVNRREAERMSRSGAYLPPRGAGLERAGLSGIGEQFNQIWTELKDNPIAWGLIALVALWVFTREWTKD